MWVDRRRNEGEELAKRDGGREKDGREREKAVWVRGREGKGGREWN